MIPQDLVEPRLLKPSTAEVRVRAVTNGDDGRLPAGVDRRHEERHARARADGGRLRRADPAEVRPAAAGAADGRGGQGGGRDVLAGRLAGDRRWPGRHDPRSVSQRGDRPLSVQRASSAAGVRRAGGDGPAVRSGPGSRQSAQRAPDQPRRGPRRRRARHAGSGAASRIERQRGVGQGRVVGRDRAPVAARRARGSAHAAWRSRRGRVRSTRPARARCARAGSRSSGRGRDDRRPARRSRATRNGCCTRPERGV